MTSPVRKLVQDDVQIDVDAPGSNEKAKFSQQNITLLDKGLEDGRLTLCEVPSFLKQRCPALKHFDGVYVLPDYKDPSILPSHPRDFTNYVQHKYSKNFVKLFHTPTEGKNIGKGDLEFHI